jgi:hypothetical protein
VEVSVGLSALGGSGVGWWRHARGGMERRRVEMPIGTVEEGSLQWMDVSRHFSSSDKVVATGECCLDLMLHSSLRRLVSLGTPTPPLPILTLTSTSTSTMSKAMTAPLPSTPASVPIPDGLQSPSPSNSSCTPLIQHGHDSLQHFCSKLVPLSTLHGLHDVASLFTALCHFPHDSSATTHRSILVQTTPQPDCATAEGTMHLRNGPPDCHEPLPSAHHRQKLNPASRA